jgi:tetratricopeptide (TPR) repeat protein
LHLLLSFDDDTSRAMAERVVCNSEDSLRTLVVVMLFAGRLMAASEEHQQARRWMAEAQQTTNPVRLLLLAMKIRDSLAAARAKEPDNVEVRLDLVRFYTVAPRIAGGGIDDARAEAAEIAKRDVPLGHFARGYIEYREKNFGIARRELREAIRLGNPSTRALAMQWLGWLSQESQQWDDAFALFEELGALYEIGRTAVFCSCQVERGRAALQEHLKAKPKDADARKLLQRLEH